MKNKKTIWIFVLLLLGVLISACGDEKTVDEIVKNTVVIQSDGSVLDYQVEEFDTTRYVLSELTRMVNQEIDTYNKETPTSLNNNGKPLVSVEEVSLFEDSRTKVRLCLEFQSVKAMKEYYALYDINRDFFYGTVSEAIAAGYNVQGNLYVRKKKNAVQISADQLEKLMSKKILIVKGETLAVRFDKKLLYYSNGVSVNKGKTEALTTEQVENYLVFE